MAALISSPPESMKAPCTEWRSVDSDCSTAAQSLAFFEEESEATSLKNISPKAEICIIFDWDDTLLPSSFLEDAARMYSSYSPGLRRRAGRSRAAAGLPADFPCYAAIQEHGQLITQALRLAKTCADRVAIVTLSDRPWVFQSADQYLPGLDMAELLKELQIPIYYAPEHATSRCGEGTVAAEDMNVTMKRNAMLEFLHQTSPGWNMISIGDSSVEKEAAQACARLAESDGKPSLCKTIKLMGDPSLKQLNEQLRTITSNLESICAHQGDLDLHAQSPDDLVAQLAQLL